MKKRLRTRKPRRCATAAIGVRLGRTLMRRCSAFREVMLTPYGDFGCCVARFWLPVTIRKRRSFFSRPPYRSRLAQSDVEVRRLTYLGGANYRIMNDAVAEPLLFRAEKLARKRHPARSPKSFFIVRISNSTASDTQTRSVMRALPHAARQYHQSTIQISAMTTELTRSPNRSTTTRPSTST